MLGMSTRHSLDSGPTSWLTFTADLCLRHPTEAASGKGYDCYCTPGYTGEFCETMIQACDSQPCQGGASCATELGVYTCVCPSTLTGKHYTPH